MTDDGLTVAQRRAAGLTDDGLSIAQPRVEKLDDVLPTLQEEEPPPPEELDYVMKVEPGTIEASTVTPMEPVGEFIAPDA